MAEYLAVIACGAPLASRAHEVAAAAVEAGWLVRVVATPDAMNWVDADEVEQVTGYAPLVDQRRPGQEKRFPSPARVVVCPATLNSVSKLATAIMDTYAAGVMCEALATGTPLTLVPLISTKLWGHPALRGHLATLVAAGVTFVDVRSGHVGQPIAVESGTGDDVAAAFDPTWALASGPASVTGS